jgi:aspartyl-tRNA(Asn)/glutamyl-tRNA(Gln) amidotransferase subunit B
MCENGETIVQETRSYDADRGITFSIRTKEDADDYRYFPEPDLAPFEFTDAFINSIQVALPTLPDERAHQYVEKYGLSQYDAEQLTEEKDLSDLFEKIAASTPHKKNLANFLIGPLRAHLNLVDGSWNDVAISLENWHHLLNLVADGKLGFSVAAQKLLPLMIQDGKASPLEIAAAMNLIQDAGDDEIGAWVQQVLDAMPDKVEEYRKGKKGLIGLFVGEVKKISKGKADPKTTTDLLNAHLNKKQ